MLSVHQPWRDQHLMALVEAVQHLAGPWGLPAKPKADHGLRAQATGGVAVRFVVAVVAQVLRALS